ncbi:phage tail assembly protein [Candidatus Bartonella washoeensis]|uniref:phage tail assembly protein n=1 Tax=Candidatus Bartonella washoeensis TaxID=186739 RepID=UPI0005871F04|nr:phage tail assembly protein [Bartonella washoeensis]
MEGKAYTEITLHRTKGKDLKAIKEKEGAKQSIEMIAVFQDDVIMPLRNLIFETFKKITGL